MTGATTQFQKNSTSKGRPKILPSVNHQWSYEGSRNHDPRVVFQMTQADTRRRYTVEMTPAEARELARNLIENADTVDKLCQPRPEPMF